MPVEFLGIISMRGYDLLAARAAVSASA